MTFNLLMDIHIEGQASVPSKGPLLLVAETLLKRGGIIGIFPEGGNWATVLRPARPGPAYLATQTGAPLLPVGIDGLIDGR